jgi:hypothetical protein
LDIGRRLGTGFGYRRVVEVLALAGRIRPVQPARKRVPLVDLARDFAVFLPLRA